MMNVDDVIAHFGGVSQTARAVGVSYQAVSQWLKNGAVPPVRAFHIATIMSSKTKSSIGIWPSDNCRAVRVPPVFICPICVGESQ